MSVWFYLFILAFSIVLFLLIRILLIKNEIKNIGKSLNEILKSDTNRLITISLNAKFLKDLTITLNKSLKELRQLELEYKNGNQELKASITNISHDLRTPLTAIRGYLELMHYENLNNKQRKYLEIMDRKVKDLTELTEQLFNFSKTQDLQKEIKKEFVSINNILEETLVSFYGVFKEQNLTPKIEICDEKVMRELNENIVKRIFENIISNAIKYSEKDFFVKMDPKGTIEFSNKTSKLDSISLEKIFLRYYTVHNAKKANGIGLSIAKQLVELSGGQIEAKYEKGYLIIKVKL